MSSRKAKVISQTAFQQAFAETEVIMRLALGKLIQEAADKEDNEMVKLGMMHAKKIVAGEVT